MKQKLFEWMEDFDNDELADGAWEEVLKESVDTFNEQNRTKYDPLDSFHEYLRYKKRKSIESRN